jgi:hypothetical protein
MGASMRRKPYPAHGRTIVKAGAEIRGRLTPTGGIMSAPTIADPAAATRTASRRRPRSRLRTTPAIPATAATPGIPGAPATVDHPAVPAVQSVPGSLAVLTFSDGIATSALAAGTVSGGTATTGTVSGGTATTGTVAGSAVAAGAVPARPAAAGTPGGRRRADAAERPLTVTINIDGGGQEGRERILAALRDLVEAVGGDPVVAVDSPVTPGSGGAGPGVVNLDPKPRAAIRDGSVLDLSRLEYDLLLFLAENPRQVFSRAQLLERVWGHVHTGARTVDVHISRLRNKLDDHELITTVYGVGYRLADGAPIRVVQPA